ncbi:GGDEF domain-containing protein [Rhodococcus aerolatus]
MAELRSAFDNAPTGIAVLTPEGVVTAVNPTLGRILGRSVESVVGDSLFGFTHVEDRDAARASCGRMAGSVVPVRMQCRFTRPDGSVVWTRVSTSRVPPGATSPEHLVMHVDDITEQKALEAQLVHRATHDPLTGLGNRSHLETEAARVLGNGTVEVDPLDAGTAVGVRCAVVMLDLDGFKAVNDAHGHAAGDTALVEVARRVRESLEVGEVAVRLGGDEFAVWCPDTTPARTLQLVADLRATIAATPTPSSEVVPLAVSVGAASHTTPIHPGGVGEQVTVSVLLRAADTAMYADKHRHRTTTS